MKRIIDFLVNNYGIDANTAATLTITITIFFLGVTTTLFINYIINFIKRYYYKKSLKIIITEFSRRKIGKFVRI